MFSPPRRGSYLSGSFVEYVWITSGLCEQDTIEDLRSFLALWRGAPGVLQAVGVLRLAEPQVQAAMGPVPIRLEVSDRTFSLYRESS